MQSLHKNQFKFNKKSQSITNNQGYLSQNQLQQEHQIDQKNNQNIDYLDCTNKAYFIIKQLHNNQYQFTKKALISYLKGKPINLQQKDNKIKPPTNLKGYLYFQQNRIVQQLIERMLSEKVLKEDLVQIQGNKKYAKRIIIEEFYNIQQFPKISIAINYDFKSNKKCKKQQTRLSFFLMKKNQLQTNINKKHQNQIKEIKNKQLQSERQRVQKQKHIRTKKQETIRMQFEMEKQIQKNEKKLKTIQKMNNFWQKQTSKVNDFIKQKNYEYQQIQQVEKNYKTKNQQLSESKNLKLSFNQFKKKEKKQNKLSQPLITWNLIKSAIEGDWQKQDEKKQSLKHQQKLSKFNLFNFVKISSKQHQQKDKKWNDLFERKNNIKKLKNIIEEENSKTSSTEASITKTNFNLVPFGKTQQKNLNAIVPNQKERLKDQLFQQKMSQSIVPFNKHKQSQQRMFDSPYYGHLSLYSSKSAMRQIQSQIIQYHENTFLSTLTTSTPTQLKQKNSKDSMYKIGNNMGKGQNKNIYDSTITLTRRQPLKDKEQCYEFTMSLVNNEFENNMKGKYLNIVGIEQQQTRTISLKGNKFGIQKRLNQQKHHNKKDYFNKLRDSKSDIEQTMTLNIFSNQETKTNFIKVNKQYNNNNNNNNNKNMNDTDYDYDYRLKCTKKHKLQQNFIDELIQLEVSRLKRNN